MVVRVYALHIPTFQYSVNYVSGHVRSSHAGNDFLIFLKDFG